MGISKETLFKNLWEVYKLSIDNDKFVFITITMYDMITNITSTENSIEYTAHREVVPHTMVGYGYKELNYYKNELKKKVVYAPLGGWFPYLKTIYVEEEVNFKKR